MSYICLFCATPKTTAGNCTCNRAVQPINHWPDYHTNVRVTLANFNPSCRRCALDIHVCAATNEVYVVVRVTLAYEKGVTGVDWTTQRKVDFVKLSKAAAGLWDGGVNFTHYTKGGASAQYTPRFFLDIIDTGFFSDEHLKVTAVSSAAPQRFRNATLGTQGQLCLAPGLLVLKGPYPTTRPKPAKGTRKDYKVDVRLNEFAPYSFENDNTIMPSTNRKIVNTMAHEYGHMIGLPDEYDAYPTSFATTQLGGGRVARGTRNTDKDKTVAYWVELLGESSIASPTWGHVGDDSIMRNVDTRAGAFRSRHYVTVLEGLNLLSKTNTTLGGVWDI